MDTKISSIIISFTRENVKQIQDSLENFLYMRYNMKEGVMEMANDKLFRTIAEGCGAIARVTDIVPKVAVVLGSGLGDYAKTIRVGAKINYSDIPGFPVSTVDGHRGRLVFGHVGDVPIVLMQGRVHYYEGYSMEDVVLPIRLMRGLGADTLILTNAAGGINRSYQPGDLMLLRDHIASFVPSPLRGENADQLGLRFPDMSAVYDPQLRAIVREEAEKMGVTLQEGVYLQTAGPQFETPAEIAMFSALGADAVGMSTACEAIAANHMQMRICGISCITNHASGISPAPLTHDEVKEVADRVGGTLGALLSATILRCT